MRSLLALALVATALAGCTADVKSALDPPTQENPPTLGEVVPIEVAAAANFTASLVDVAVSYLLDLYEPTIEVSSTGVIYITGHTILVDSTGAPVFFSKDDGATWQQLPFAGSVTMPGNLPGATPPPSDEIFLVAGDDGWLYGVDITGATYPVNAWKGDGAEHAYHNPNVYDEAAVADHGAPCLARPIKDRPWAAYANGTLLMVSNPGAQAAQVGVMKVPPTGTLAAGGALAATWNVCAGPWGDPLAIPSEGGIPGIPALRADGRLAVPQLLRGVLHLVIGDAADVMATRVVEAFPTSTAGEITRVTGITTFDGEGTLFVGITNNTATPDGVARQGRLQLSASSDAGETLAMRTFTVTKPVRHFYMDGNRFGTGALVVWSTDGDTAGRYDWFTGHLQLGADGAPVLENVVVAIDEGPAPSPDVTGAAVGPDGRAYLAVYDAPGLVGQPLGTPLSVHIQQDGPTLPVGLPA